ncbi:hypothetical protein GW17_00041952, partial [Ensete ventricosum]
MREDEETGRDKGFVGLRRSNLVLNRQHLPNEVARLRRWETRHMAPEMATKTWVRHIPPPPQRNPRKPTIIHAVGRSGQRRIDNGTKRASLIRTTPTSTQQRREDDAELTTCLKYGAPSVTGAAAHRRRLDLQRRKEALANGGHR